REQEEVAAALDLGPQARAELIASLGLDRQLAVRTVWCTEPGKKEANEMINLGHGGDRAFAATARVALFDADGWRQARDQVHIGPSHLLDELARVRAHGIEEPALAFGKNNVEREGAFARTAHAGNDHEFPARNLD